MHPTALPGGANEHLLHGLFESEVGVGDDQLHAAQAAGHQLATEREPELVVLGGTDVDADDLALAAVFDRHRDQHCHGDDAAVLAHFLERRVEKQIRVCAIEPARPEGLHLGVELAADAAHLILGDALEAERFGELVDGARADAVHIRLLHHAEQRSLVAATRFQQAWEIRALAELGDLQLERAHPRVPLAIAIPVAAVQPRLGPLVRRGADQLGHLGVHQFLGKQLQPVAQKGRIDALLRLGEQVQQCHPGVGHRRGPPVGV